MHKKNFLSFKQGCTLFIFNSKILSIGWLGKKYDDLLRKNANIRGKRSKNEGKGEIFSVLCEKISLLEKGMGKKYPILGKCKPLQFYANLKLVNI